MNDIRYITLQNEGGFVAQIEIQYKRKHTDAHGNISYDAEWKSWHYDGYRDICAASERTIDLTDSDIPDGSQVRLNAIVKLGSDCTSQEQYIYSRTSPKSAVYKVSGTTLINSLKRVSYK
ncbi:MAG: hypothetical protein HFE49_05945 [Clostridia bacterium]|nr:hypothetical protein [Clostridia bacterium]